MQLICAWQEVLVGPSPPAILTGMYVEWRPWEVSPTERNGLIPQPRQASSPSAALEGV